MDVRHLDMPVLGNGYAKYVDGVLLVTHDKGAKTAPKSYENGLSTIDISRVNTWKCGDSFYGRGKCLNEAQGNNADARRHQGQNKKRQKFA